MLTETEDHTTRICSHHQISRTYLPTPETDLGCSVPHCSVSIVRQQFVAQETTTSASLAVMQVKQGLQAAEPVKIVKGSLALLLATTAEADVCRPSSYYSWQCRSLGHQPHRSPRHCKDSPLPCTETDIPPGTNTTAAGTCLTRAPPPTTTITRKFS